MRAGRNKKKRQESKALTFATWPLFGHSYSTSSVLFRFFRSPQFTWWSVAGAVECHWCFHQNQLGFPAGLCAVEWKIALFFPLSHISLFHFCAVFLRPFPFLFFCRHINLPSAFSIFSSAFFYPRFLQLWQLAKWYVKMTADEIDDVSFASRMMQEILELLPLVLLQMMMMMGLSDVPWQIDTLPLGRGKRFMLWFKRALRINTMAKRNIIILYLTLVPRKVFQDYKYMIKV